MTQLIDAYMAAQVYRGREQASKINDLSLRQAERQEATLPRQRELADAVLGGNTNALGELVSLNPELATTASNIGLNFAKTAEAQRENLQKYLGTTMQAFRALPDEESRRAARDKWAASPFTAAIVPGQLLQQIVQEDDFSDAGLDQGLAAMGIPTAQPDPVNLQFKTVVVDGQPGVYPVDPRTGQRSGPSIGQPFTPPRQGVRFRAADGSEFIMGDGTSPPIEPTTKTVNDAQDKLVFIDTTLARLDEIAQSADPEFLTYMGRANAFLASIKDKAKIDLSPEERRMLGQITTFKQGVDRLFNAYRKEITGAASAVQELQQIKDSFLNSGLSPEEFKASFTSYRNELLRTRRLMNQIIREGFSEFDDEKDRGAILLNRRFLTGEDDDAESRLAELRQQGVSDEEALELLIKEGYQ